MQKCLSLEPPTRTVTAWKSLTGFRGTNGSGIDSSDGSSSEAARCFNSFLLFVKIVHLNDEGIFPLCTCVSMSNRNRCFVGKDV